MLLNSEPISEDFGFLFLRVGAGGALFMEHGWPKLMHFSDKMDTFPDPLGMGSAISLILVVLAEVICSALIVLGLWTRIASIPVIVTMAVIVFMVNGDAVFAEKELAALYLLAFLAILFTGSGRYALDRLSFN